MLGFFSKNNNFLKLIRLIFLALPFVTPFIFAMLSNSSLHSNFIKKITDLGLKNHKYFYVLTREKANNQKDLCAPIIKAKDFIIVHKDIENKELRRLLKYKNNTQSQNFFATTKIIINFENISSNIATIPLGEKSGIKKNYIAINEFGIVGVIDKVFDSHSTIMLVNNKKINLPVTIYGGKKTINAIFNGSGSSLTFVEEDKLKDINIGNEVFLLESDEKKRKKIKLGKVKTIKNNSIIVEPENKSETIEFVMIID